MPEWEKARQDVTSEIAAQEQAKSFFWDLLESADNAILKRSKETLVIHSLHRCHFLWGESQVLWEERALREDAWPTDEAPTGGQPHLASEFDPWVQEMPSAPEGFREETREDIIPASRFVEVCPECEDKKEVVCYDCGGDGQVVCPRCGGGGAVTCPSCGGGGTFVCGSCGGHGEVIVSSRTYSDGNGVTQTEHDYRTCGACGGRGIVSCSRCGGSGRVICSGCGGSGEVVCASCEGSGIVTCRTCDGHGRLLHGVVLTQSFHTRAAKQPLTRFKDLFDRYPDLDIPTEAVREADFTRMESGAGSAAPALTDFLPQGELEDQDVPARLDDLLAQNRGDLEHLNYQRLSVYSKELLDICYSLQGREYHVLLDADSGKATFDTHPYHDILTSQTEELRRLQGEKDYRGLHDLSQQFMALAKTDEAYGAYATECKKILRKTNVKFALWASLGSVIMSLLVQLVWMLLSRAWALSPAMLIPALIGILLSVALRKTWGQLPRDGETQFVISGLVLGLLLGGGVTALCLVIVNMM